MHLRQRGFQGSEVLSGVGTLFVGIAALLALYFEFGARRKVSELEDSIALMLPIYRRYMATEEGIVWGDYPADAEQIIAGISRQTGLDPKTTKRLLDKLKQEGKI